VSDYSFHSFDAHGIVALSHKIVCRDDLDALDHGVRRSGGHALEIFQGSRLVARVKLGNAPLDIQDARSL